MLSQCWDQPKPLSRLEMKALWRKWTLLPLRHQAIAISAMITAVCICTADDGLNAKKRIAYSSSALICSFFIPKDYHL